jgi:hypothetical protein
LDVALSNWISIAAAIVAFGSMVVAWQSYRLAQRSFHLAQESYGLSKPNVAAYLVDVFWYRPKGEKTLYVFCLSVENKSTIQNAIVNAEMRLPFIRDNVERLAVFEHTRNPECLEILGLRNVAELPPSISIRGAVTMNFCFEVPNSTLAGAEFDVHTLRLRCTDGSNVDLRPKMIMALLDVQDLEEKRKAGVPV